jgi:ribosomal protein S25
MTTKKAAKKKAKKKVAKKTRAKSAKDLERKTPHLTEESVEDALVTIGAEQALSADPAFAKFEVAKRVAHSLAHSNLVPEAFQRRPNDCFVAINMGAEVGMEPFQAIQSIAVIDGKPCLYGDGLIGVVRASPLCEWINETMNEEGTKAICEAKRKGDPHVKRAEYSMTDAMLAGIDSRKNWKKHPKRMLQMRARAYCLRDAFPDVLKGLGVVEEMRDHEDTPAEIQNFDLPSPPEDPMLAEAKKVFGDGVTVTTEEPSSLMKKVFEKYPQGSEINLSLVEHAIYQSDNMKELLEAGELAKHLDERDRGTARISYSKMRTALLEKKND